MAAQKLFYHAGPSNPDPSRPKYMLAAAYTQMLYGAETLAKVDSQAQQVFTSLDESMPFQVRYMGTVKTPEESKRLVAATQDIDCIGLAGWAHTFHPTGQSLTAFESLKVPFINVITSFDSTIPETINMDYMNLNQCPHGYQELSTGLVRSRIYQNPVAGNYTSDRFINKFEMYGRVAAAVNLLRYGRILTIGGKMEDVSGTDIAPEMMQRALGPRIVGKESGDLVKYMANISPEEVKKEAERIEGRYNLANDIKPGGARRDIFLDAVQQSLGVRQMVKNLECIAWTSYFGNLGQLKQLQGFAAQDSMYDGMGFGAEGDVQAAALVAALLTMGQGRPGASSFSEPYVFDFDRKGILYAHMLESNPALAPGKTTLEVQPLSIGGKGDPVRAVFDFAQSACILTSLFNTPDLGMQLMTIPGRIIATPNLPDLRVAKGLVRPDADLETAMECAAYAGMTHHPAISTAVPKEYVLAFANMKNLRHHVIDGNTDYWEFHDKMDEMSGRFNGN